MFMNQMTFYIVSDLMLCRAFSLPLKGEALTWFNSLSDNFVYSFTIVCSLFDK